MDTLDHLGVQQMEMHELGLSSGIVHTCLGSRPIKITVRLDRVFRGAQVGIDFIVATAGSRMLQQNVLAGARG